MCDNRWSAAEKGERSGLNNNMHLVRMPLPNPISLSSYFKNYAFLYVKIFVLFVIFFLFHLLKCCVVGPLCD